MDNEILYLLSERFPYEKTIHADAGPGYARRHKWRTAPLSALREAAPHGPVIIDNRVVAEELAELSALLPRLAPHPVHVKVVDPYWDCIQQPYYRWLLTLTQLRHVYFVGPYRPTGMTALLRDIAGSEAYLHLPYAYEPERELPIDHRARRLITITGAANWALYPERAGVIRALRRRWWIGWRAHILRHPGYPDIGQVARHSITGDRFVAFLAGFRFMYLEPSREGLEFLKYSECAYAGCAPAGRSPGMLPPEARAGFAAFESGQVSRHLRQLGSTPVEASEEAARAYRASLRQSRDAATISASLLAHWNSARARTGALDR